MPRLEVNLSAIQRLIDQLSEQEKIKLVRKLEAQTLPARWKALFREIDKRRKRYPITQREIEKICEEVRQERYERSRS